MNRSETVAKILLEIKAVSLNAKEPFRYASGILSPIYTDCRVLISFPDKRNIVRDLYVEAIQESGENVEVVAGTATAGIPHAAWVAEKLDLPMIYVRGKAKEHGKKNQIEGILNEGQTAIVIEDLISTGESSVETAEAIKEAGGKVSYIFAITTYGMQRSKDNFENHNLKLISLTTFTDIVKMAVEMSYITKEEQDTILEWAKDPASWGKKMGFE